jgi:thymidine phosphorylase
VTATIASIPLVASSIMSKKIAEGSNALVLDVKCGDGAFMKDAAEARAAAAAMVAIGRRAGVRTEAFITDMDAPLGAAVGNALEVAESIETLRGAGPPDLTAIVVRLAARMLLLAGVERDEAAAAGRVETALASGRALETFARMAALQGGDRRVVEDPTRLPAAPARHLFTASRGGFVTAVRAGAIGRASHVLGAGRDRVGDAIDHAVGLKILTPPGSQVAEGDPLLELHHRDGRGVEQALALCRAALMIGDEPPPPRRKVMDEIR